ncbi:hypothetical protein BDV96DRAFT_336645 [Lophiotrema nucula]|uniref:COP9 signalosome complex subunit 3 n=1 Tax=Lophiotrema nucula TaxID=690887 RepID=A0A6A5YGT4_9PLEO|nr:hypothetical protein BDV96DRAFT_336645 [Lophiotrema nucula]
MAGEVLAHLLEFQPSAPEVQQKREYDAAARQFVAKVSNISHPHFLKGAETSGDVLEILHPESNSIAYIFALHARISALSDAKFQKGIPDQLRPGGYIWNKVENFMQNFDPVQVRYVGQEWRRLMDYLERVARLMGSPGVAISPIRSGLLRLDPLSGTFTLTHLYFIRLCMETRSYTAALPILDNYISSLPSTLPAAILQGMEYSSPSANHVVSGEYIHAKSGHTDKITMADVQEYYVLGAMAYLGLSQFNKAKQFLEHALVAPANNVANGLMLEAYKKWVLLSCLVDGTIKGLPRTANTAAIKQIRTSSKAYEALADAYTQLRNLPKLKAQINAGKDLWAEDGNTGLVKELLEQQQKLYISWLSRTYSAIPVTNFAGNLGLTKDELTGKLEELINKGQLNATIQRSGAGDILRFFLDPTQGPLAKTETQQQQALYEQTQRTNLLAEQVKSADYRLSLTKEYIEHIKRQNKKMAANASGEPMDTTWDDGMEAEEDLMGDLH